MQEGYRENVDGIFSAVGVLYVNKWNGLDNWIMDNGLGSLYLTPLSEGKLTELNNDRLLLKLIFWPFHIEFACTFL